MTDDHHDDGDGDGDGKAQLPTTSTAHPLMSRPRASGALRGGKDRITRALRKGALPLLALALGAAAGCDDGVELTPEGVQEEPAPRPTAEAVENAAEAAQAEGESEAADTIEGAAPAEQSATVGQPAPDFALTDQAGVEHTLASLRGKIVVLEWINPQCPFVQRHYESGTMTRLDGELADDEVTWLAMDSSHFVEASDAETWRKEHELAYPILLDADGKVGHAYNARTTPHMFVIDGEGVLRYSGAIDDDPRGRNDSPTNYVSQAVQALRSGNLVPTSQTEPYGCSVKYENS